MKKDITLKEKFLSISSWEELADLVINYQKTKETIPAERLEKKHISYALFDRKPKYKKYQIRKKAAGKFREIDAPIGKLKTIQKIIKSCIELCFTPKSAAHGFVKERSIVTNARQHKGRKFVYNIDLEDFFPSIHFGRVRGIFKSKPFCFPPEVAKHLANLCCNDLNVLPQGGATSPIISNLICRALDGKLSAFAKRHKIKFTRYADDITFSSNRPVFEGKDFIDELKHIIENENFKINEKKVRLQNQYQRQVVTGLTVNKKVNVSKRFINDLDFQIWLFVKDPVQAQIRLEQNYTKRHRYGGEVPKIERVIQGKLDFLRMVIGEDSARYKRLADKFLAQIQPEEEKITEHEEIESEESLKKTEQQEIRLVKKEFQEEFAKIDSCKTEEEVSEILLSIKLKINECGKMPHLKKLVSLEKEKFKEKIQTPQNKYLTYSLKNEKIEDPFGADSEYDNFIEKNRPKTKYKNAPKNPQHLAEFLHLFRSGSSHFKDLVHSNSLLYKNVIDNAKNEFNLIGKKEKGVFNQKIPKEIYIVVREFINNLALVSRKREKKYDDLPYSIFFKEKRGLIRDFNRYYRFTNDDNQGNGVKISEIIKYVFSKDSDNYNKIWYLDIDTDIDKTFSNVLTSTYNIALAIEKILLSCKEFSDIGAVRFKATRWKNKVVLRITNLNVSLQHKTAFEYLNDLGGDTNTLITLLTGYCDFNIIANFQDGKSKLSLIPYSDTEGVSSNYDPEGFTYELIFYRPLKFLLIDNGDNNQRIEKAKTIISNNGGFGYILSSYKTFDFDTNEYQLTSFNAVFVHVNNPEFENLKKYLINNKIPTISFGGEKWYNKITINYDMSDSQFYDNLENYIKIVKESSDLSFDFWEQQIQSNQSIIKDLDEIADKIQNNGISLENLPDDIKNDLFNFIGHKIDLPAFENLRQLMNFCKRQKLK